MKKILKPMAVICLLLSSPAFAQDDAGMKAWQDYMTPGEVHKMMAAANGEWNGAVTMWMDPKAPPTQSTGTVTNEMIMGGRYQLSKTTSTMMGMPFEGMSLLGYDNAKKVFTTTWIDNVGTGTMTLEGTWTAATKSIEFKGKAVDPMTGRDMAVKEVVKFIDNDTQEMQMYEMRNGAEIKTMEIKYTRKK
jgi:Protein of unknown function (DUF1579)